MKERKKDQEEEEVEQEEDEEDEEEEKSEYFLQQLVPLILIQKKYCSASNLNSPGRGHVSSLFVNEEQKGKKKVGS